MIWSRPLLQDSTHPDLTHADSTRPAPFVLERRFEDVRQGGYFTPTAAVWLTPALHESGLLRDLSPDDLRVLLAVISSVSGNGTFIATPERLAPILGLSTRSARSGLERLQTLVWNGAPLLSSRIGGSQVGEGGLHFFHPSPHLIEERHSVISPSPGPGESVKVPEITPPEIAPPGEVPVVPRSVREEVIAQSRASYTRPRAQVEAEIDRFLSRDRQKPHPESERKKGQEKAESQLPATPEAREWLRLKRALVGLGVPLHRAQALLETHPAQQIARQLEWLAYRHARNPVAYVIAAIEKNYAPPPAVGLQRATEEQRAKRTEAMAPGVGTTPDGGTSGELQQEASKADADPVEIEVLGMETLTDRKVGNGAP